MFSPNAGARDRPWLPERRLPLAHLPQGRGSRKPVAGKALKFLTDQPFCHIFLPFFSTLALFLSSFILKGPPSVFAKCYFAAIFGVLVPPSKAAFTSPQIPGTTPAGGAGPSRASHGPRWPVTCPCSLPILYENKVLITELHGFGAWLSLPAALRVAASHAQLRSDYGH